MFFVLNTWMINTSNVFLFFSIAMFLSCFFLALLARLRSLRAVHVAARKVIADELPHAGSVGVEPRKKLKMLGEEDHVSGFSHNNNDNNGISMRFSQQQS